MTDDRAHHPVIAADRVLLASSTDDTVYCLHVPSGKTLLSFTTDGPVRYAPTVAGQSG